WISVNQALEQVDSWVLHSIPGQSQNPVLQLLDGVYPGIDPADPFLQSCFWEKCYVRRAADNDFSGMLETLKQGLQKGYPLAHFYDNEGILLEQAGQKAQGRQAFQKALQAPLNLTNASENLN